MAPPTATEMAAWPVTVDVPTAGTALGLGREASYRAAASGELPGAIRVGRRWRVVTRHLRDALGVGSDPPSGAVAPVRDTGANGAEHDAVAGNETNGLSLRSVAGEGGDTP